MLVCQLGLDLPTKINSEKLSEFWKNFLTSTNSTDFSNYLPIKNSPNFFCQLATLKKLDRKFSNIRGKSEGKKFSEFV